MTDFCGFGTIFGQKYTDDDDDDDDAGKGSRWEKVRVTIMLSQQLQSHVSISYAT